MQEKAAATGLAKVVENLQARMTQLRDKHEVEITTARGWWLGAPSLFIPGDEGGGDLNYPASEAHYSYHSRSRMASYFI